MDTESKTNIDDLFAGDADKPRAAKPKRKPRAAAKTRADEPKPATDDEPIDTAVRIRRLDWECECGNTNTLDLRRCGKCHQHRYH